MKSLAGRKYAYMELSSILTSSGPAVFWGSPWPRFPSSVQDVDRNGPLLAPLVPPWCILWELLWPFLFVVRVAWPCDIAKLNFTTEDATIGITWATTSRLICIAWTRTGLVVQIAWRHLVWSETSTAFQCGQKPYAKAQGGRLRPLDPIWHRYVVLTSPALLA